MSRPGRLLWLASLLTLGLAGDLLAHLALSRSSPAADEMLSAAPVEIALFFTEEIEIALSSITLTGPAGGIGLSAPVAGESAAELRATITGELMAGGYIVQWQAVGGDGHPVRGEFAFTIAAGAAGLPVDITPTPGALANPVSPIPAPSLTFDAQSPLYAGARWLNYLGLIGSIGSAAFLALLVGTTRTADLEELSRFESGARRATIRLGLLAALLLAVSLVLRLQAQSHAVFGRGISERSLELLTDSAWGSAWLLQGVAAAVLMAGLLLALRTPVGGAVVAGLAAAALALSPALASHAATVGGFSTLAVLSDGLHVLAAGTWLGALLAFVIAGVPNLRRLPDLYRPAAYTALLRSFSGMALLSGAVIVTTGVFAAALQLDGPSDLWTTAYGKALTAKLLLALCVFAVGAFNWRRLPLQREQPGAIGAFRRNATLELGLTLFVVAATAVLVAIPPPSHAEEPLATTTSIETRE